MRGPGEFEANTNFTGLGEASRGDFLGDGDLATLLGDLVFGVFALGDFPIGVFFGDFAIGVFPLVGDLAADLAGDLAGESGLGFGDLEATRGLGLGDFVAVRGDLARGDFAAARGDLPGVLARGDLAGGDLATVGALRRFSSRRCLWASRRAEISA